MTTIIAVANLKGGTAKTTTAAYLAHCLPSPVLAIDADPQRSLSEWSECGWPVPVAGLAVRNLHEQLPGIAGRKYEWVVIDTPPLEQQSGVVHSALRAADVVVVPVSTTTMELTRLGPIRQAVEDVAALRKTPAEVRVLLTRTRTNTTSLANAREVLEEDGWTVLATSIPKLERYGLAFGDQVAIEPDDPYLLATSDLLASLNLKEIK